MSYARNAVCLVTLVVACGCGSVPGRGPETLKDRGATRETMSIQVGGLYCTQEKDGSWRVLKVLAVDNEAVHLRSYANKFTEKPIDVDPSKLSLGSISDPSGFGVGHFPLAKAGFFKSNPVFIKVVPVNDEELEGYKLYLEAMKDGGK